MLLLLIINKLLNIDYYNKYRYLIKVSKEDKEINNLYTVLDSMIESYKRTLSFEEYKLIVLEKYPDYLDLIAQIEHSNIKDDVLVDAIKTLVEQEQARELAMIAIEVSEGRKSINTILDYYDKFDQRDSVKEIEFVTDDLETLYEDTIHKQGLRWRLSTLNRMLGSLRKGDFGFLFARPETGKTTFLSSEITFMAEQLGEESGPILWFNNEEQGSKVRVRSYQASLGVDLTQLYSNRPQATKIYLDKTKSKIKIIDNAAIHKRMVENVCKQLKPSLIIFDQIDKIKGFDSDREDLRLGSIYIWARELAKSYCPVIGVCQADVSGEGKKWLDMSSVANAKTSKQAEADWILGIGAVHDIGLEHIRYLHLSKNKLTGDEDSDPTLRHGRMEVVIRPEIARFEDLT